MQAGRAASRPCEVARGCRREIGVGEGVDGFGQHPNVFQREAGSEADAGRAADGDGEGPAGGGEDGLVGSGGAFELRPLLLKCFGQS